MKKALIFGLLLAMVLSAGCVEKEITGETQLTTAPSQEISPIISEEQKRSFIGVAPRTEIEQIFLKKEFVLSEVPILNKPVELTYIVGEGPLQSAEIIILLPEGFELVSGNLSARWPPDKPLNKNSTIVLKAIIKAVKPGNWTIRAFPRVKEWGETSDTSRYFYVEVGEKTSKIHKTPFPFPAQSPAGPPSEYRPLDLKLEMAGIPKLNNTVELIATVISNVDENSVNVPFDPKNITFTIFLPEGFELVSGNLVWNGKLTTTKPILLRATVKAVKTGDWQISLVPLKGKPFAVGCAFNGYMDIRITEKEGWQRFGKGGCLFVRITNETGEVSEVPLPSPSLPPKTTLAPFETIPPLASPPPTTPQSPIPTETKPPPIETASPAVTYYPPIATSPPTPSSNASK